MSMVVVRAYEAEATLAPLNVGCDVLYLLAVRVKLVLIHYTIYD
jgi:hypothetical protein